MKLNKPKFWETKNFISLLLYPLTIITFLINFSKKFSIKKIFKIKTICIGNVFIGGTGKTSLAIEIYKLLGTKLKPVFIKKKYENHFDEINLLKDKGKIIFTSSRENALFKAKDKKFKVAILDDGLQQKNIKEIYTFLNNIKMSSSTFNILKMENTILKKLKAKTNKKNIKKIIKIGNNILKKNLFYINKYLV